jgi:N-acetylglucosaminyl-diphospho-decaprenol L-rhamnosyltransferase
LSVIVVSYNTRDLLRRCLASLEGAHEAIVVDNASLDGSAAMVASEFPSVRLIENRANVGFGQANNQGIGAMTGDVALLLNSDAFATPGALERLEAVFVDPSIVAAGGRLVDAKAAGEPAAPTQESVAGPLTLWAVFCEQSGLEQIAQGVPWLSPYWQTRRILAQNPGASVVPVTQVQGACLAMRPVERFDERFFLYAEDTELCRRLARHGRIVFVPAAVFGHTLGASSSHARWDAVARYNRGKELYFRIHHGRAAAMVCCVLDRLGAAWRLLVWALVGLVRPRHRARAGLFWRVLTAPIAGPPDPRQTSAE